jgi:hypothetical protein
VSKVLIITGQFIPYTKSLGGILRVYSFINSLKKKHKVYLLVSKSLTNKKYGYLGIKKKDLKGISLYYIRNNSSKFILSIFNFKIFRNLFYLLGLDYVFNINNEFLKISNQIIKKNKIDYVIISSPPFSLFYLVKKIRLKFKKIKIILDYRDGWSTRIDNFFINPVKSIVKNYIEKNILKHSDCVIAATYKIQSKLNFLIKDQLKVLLLRNGFFYKPKRVKKKNKQIKIGYFGLISEDSSSYRNIRIVYDVIKNNRNLQKKFIFEFYGNNEIKDKDIKNFKTFKFKNNLKYKKALSKMTEMDYLLVLHTEKSTSEEMVTSKFYDYLASSTPIVNISSGKNEVGEIIKKLNLGYNVDYENNNLEKFLIELKKYNKKIKWKKNFDIYSRKHQNKKLLDIIK